jgi:ribonuclease HI
MAKKVILITDGACIGNPGPGGWACILRYGEVRREMFGYAPHTTNNRMELMAAIQGLAALKSACEVEALIDSEYLMRGATKALRFWKRHHWWRKLKRPLRNADLWVELDHYLSIHTVTWSWVRGHSGHPDNEQCDWLATNAARDRKSSWEDGRSHAPMRFNYGADWIPPHPQASLFDMGASDDGDDDDFEGVG